MEWHLASQEKPDPFKQLVLLLNDQSTTTGYFAASNHFVAYTPFGSAGNPEFPHLVLAEGRVAQWAYLELPAGVEEN